MGRQITLSDLLLLLTTLAAGLGLIRSAVLEQRLVTLETALDDLATWTDEDDEDADYDDLLAEEDDDGLLL